MHRIKPEKIRFFRNGFLFSVKNRAENGPDDPGKPRGAGPRPHKDTEGTLGDSHANFHLHWSSGLGGDSEQRSKIWPDFTLKQSLKLDKTAHISAENGPINYKFRVKVRESIPEVDNA